MTVSSKASLVVSFPITIVGLWLTMKGHADPLADELRRFRTLTNRGERIEAIRRFGKINDPRVTLILMEALQEDQRDEHRPDAALLFIASSMLVYYHIPEKDWLGTKYWTNAIMWWESHETEVRRRASALPQ
jgi:hypothetical protein